MRYALLVYQDETAVISDEERSRRDAAFAAFQDEMHEHGALLGGALLQPAATSATVRCWDGGDVIVADGPPARPSERLAGFFIVDGKDRDAAITIATRVPAAWYGTVEVRPTRGGVGRTSLMGPVPAPWTGRGRAASCPTATGRSG